MPTAHEAAADRMMRKWMQDPHGANALSQAIAGLQDGHYDEFSVDAIGQVFRSRPHQWPMGQIAAFAATHVDICHGKIGLTDILTEAEPEADRNREENAAVLARLPDPFIARVHMTQYGADSDGDLEWTEPILVNVATASERTPDGGLRPKMRTIEIPPRRVPLEIGFSHPSRTIVHIREERGVARWPYHHEMIRIFLNIEQLAPGEVPTLEQIMTVE